MINQIVKGKVIGVEPSDNRINITLATDIHEPVWCLGSFNSIESSNISMDDDVIAFGTWVRDPQGNRVFLRVDNIVHDRAC